MYHMHYQTPHAPPCTTKHHYAPHTHICTTWTTIDICLPPNNNMHQEIFYLPHAPPNATCTKCTTKHHHAPHTHIYTTWTTIHLCVPPNSNMYQEKLYVPHGPHAPPKNKIYLVGLPSTLYERPCQCETSELKQLILRDFK